MAIQWLVDSAHGVYIPQIFVTTFPTNDWGITEAQAEVLRQGPNHADADGSDDPQEVYAEQCWGELYWDVWDEVLNNAQWRDGEGNVWRLYQDDGDLFAAMDQENSHG